MQVTTRTITWLFLIAGLGLSGCAQNSQPKSSIQTQQVSNSKAKASAPSYKLPRSNVSAAFPYQSHYLNVLGSRMHYVEKGKGDPVVFIHGNPTSSYLWRNIIPYVAEQHRAIAIDLIGMGKSDKPAIGYTFKEHYQYVEKFVEELGLKNITFVIHDWGATIGFEYARRNPGKVKAIAFMEGVLPPIFPQPGYEAMGEKMGGLFRMLKDPVKGKKMVIDNNGFVEQLLPAFTNRTLGESEMSVYRAPYKHKASRKPTLVWPLEIPIGGKPAATTKTMQALTAFMQRTELPILLLYASPGAVVPPQIVPWYEKHIRNLETTFIGQGFHYVQEDQPDAIGLAIRDWMRRHSN